MLFVSLEDCYNVKEHEFKVIRFVIVLCFPIVTLYCTSSKVEYMADWTYHLCKRRITRKLRMHATR
jgi:hypothetical protein